MAIKGYKLLADLGTNSCQRLYVLLHVFHLIFKLSDTLKTQGNAITSRTTRQKTALTVASRKHTMGIKYKTHKNSVTEM